MHATCLDPQTPSIPWREATIETWAELILIALLSKGDMAATKRLWAIQSQWVSNTNWRSKEKHHVHDQSDYGWRYMNGRAFIYASLGCALPPYSGHAPTSSRFTHPELGD
jgi:hypothetical protein